MVHPTGGKRVSGLLANFVPKKGHFFGYLGGSCKKKTVPRFVPVTGKISTSWPFQARGGGTWISTKYQLQSSLPPPRRGQFLIIEGAIQGLLLWVRSKSLVVASPQNNRFMLVTAAGRVPDGLDFATGEDLKGGGAWSRHYVFRRLNQS